MQENTQNEVDLKMEINELIQQHLEIKTQVDGLKNEDEAIKAEIKLKLKEANMERYEDSSNNLVTLKEQTRESLDKAKVKALIGDEKYDTVVNKTKFEVLKIFSKESRNKIKANFK